MEDFKTELKAKLDNKIDKEYEGFDFSSLE